MSAEMIGGAGMQRLAEQKADWPVTASPQDNKADYVPLMLQAMRERGIGLRSLSLQTGIHKSRLGLLLHREPAKRSVMALGEFQRILAALDLDVIEAAVTIEIMRVVDHDDLTRHRRLIAMLCTMFRELPLHVVQALQEVDGVDGTEARVEWAPVLQQAVIRRVVQEIAAVVTRRAALGDFSIFS